MRVLILNWRCPFNPKAGGAELFTHGVARGLVAQGDEVEWFSASFPGATDREELDGIRFVRAGKQSTVHLNAFRLYRKVLRYRFDVVIDEVNTIPFFTPLWSSVPCFMLIHQLAKEVWWYESPFPINVIGYVAEPLYLRCYRRESVLTVSPSTEADLRRLGFTGPITIVPEGVEPAPAELGPKAKEPTFLYVGRLAASKRIEQIVLAFHQFRQQAHAGQLSLIGQGDRTTTKSILSLVRQLGLEQNITLLGWVSNEEKYRRMAGAHALLMASVREGWGLAVSEANACGTPAIVYDVPGLRDAVRHEETGLIVPASPHHLAEGMLRLVRDKGLYARLSSGALQLSRTLSFDRSAVIFREAIASSHAGSASQASSVLTAKDPIAPASGSET